MCCLGIATTYTMVGMVGSWPGEDLPIAVWDYWAQCEKSNLPMNALICCGITTRFFVLPGPTPFSDLCLGETQIFNYLHTENLQKKLRFATSFQLSFLVVFHIDPVFFSSGNMAFRQGPDLAKHGTFCGVFCGEFMLPFVWDIYPVVNINK